MASITVRNLDDEVKSKLRVRAARHGRSMEEEARVILSEGVDRQEGGQQRESLADAIRKVIEPLGGVDLEIPSRREFGMREPPDFSGPEYDR